MVCPVETCKISIKLRNKKYAVRYAVNYTKIERFWKTGQRKIWKRKRFARSPNHQNSSIGRKIEGDRAAKPWIGQQQLRISEQQPEFGQPNPGMQDKVEQNKRVHNAPDVTEFASSMSESGLKVYVVCPVENCKISIKLRVNSGKTKRWQTSWLFLRHLMLLSNGTT